MAALQGLAGLYPDTPDMASQVMDEGVLEARAAPGTPVDDHGDYGSQYNGYSGAVPTQSPFSGFPVYEGFDPAYENTFGPPGQVGENQYSLHEPGEPEDMTPTTHASPSPRIGLSSMISWDNPDGAALVGAQGNDLHGPDFGGVEFKILHDTPGRENPTDYTTNMYVAPNENYLSTVSDQLKSGTLGGSQGSSGGSRGGSGGGGSNADVTQGYGQLNSMPEFNAGHSIRREQHDRMPWDFTATHGEQDVPFYGRHPIEQMPLDGPDSPYFDNGSIDGANIPWEARIGDPTQYIQPAEVTVSASPLPVADYYSPLSF
jgi:hypothetical protein